jgi:hypothetical protein
MITPQNRSESGWFRWILRRSRRSARPAPASGREHLFVWNQRLNRTPLDRRGNDWDHENP